MTPRDDATMGRYLVLSIFVLLVTVVCYRRGIERVDQLFVPLFSLRVSDRGHGRKSGVTSFVLQY